MPSSLSLTEFFKIKLNAPMLNNRWSWGAVRDDKSAVYLSIWQDEIKRDNPKDSKSTFWVNVLWSEEMWNEFNLSSLARNERVQHIDLIKSGIPGFGLVKIAKDTNARPREMREFNSEYLFSFKNNFRETETGILQVELGAKHSL